MQLQKKFTMKKCLIFVTFSMILYLNIVHAKYEIIMDRMETLLGENDGIIRRVSNRIRKYNRQYAIIRDNQKLFDSK